MNVMGSGFSYGRPVSTSSSLSSVIPSPYSQPTGPEQYQRQPPLYTSGYPFPGYQTEPATNNPPYYQAPILPRDQRPPPMPQNEPQMGSRVGSSLQLPPIRSPDYQIPLEPAFTPQPRPAMTPQQYPSQQSQQTSQPTPAGRTGSETREPDAKRPKMDIQGILGPRQD